jgi:hypothetical protein
MYNGAGMFSMRTAVLDNDRAAEAIAILRHYFLNLFGCKKVAALAFACR